MARPRTAPPRTVVKLTLDRSQLAQLDDLARVHGRTRQAMAGRVFASGLDTYPQAPGHEGGCVLTTTDQGLVLTLRAYKPEQAKLLHELIEQWETANQ